MVIELLVFIVLVVLLSTMVKVKEHFVDGDDGMGFLADLLRPDQMVIELLYDKFEVFNYERSNGKPDMYDSQLSDIYYGRLKDRIAVIADKRIEHIGSSPPFLMVPAFKRSYFGDITERVVLIIDKNKVNKKNLVQFLAELTGNKALTGTIEGDLSITGNLAVAQNMTASSITMGGAKLSDLFASKSEVSTLIAQANQPKPCFSYTIKTERGEDWKAYKPSETDYTVVFWDTVDFDTQGVLENNTTFKPKQKGYYQLNWSVLIGFHNVQDSVIGGNEECFTIFHKNGTPYVWGANYQTTVKHWNCSNGSALVYMNGTTDYCDVRVLNRTGSEIRIVKDHKGHASRFSGFMASA